MKLNKSFKLEEVTVLWKQMLKNLRLTDEIENCVTSAATCKFTHQLSDEYTERNMRVKLEMAILQSYPVYTS